MNITQFHKMATFESKDFLGVETVSFISVEFVWFTTALAIQLIESVSLNVLVNRFGIRIASMLIKATAIVQK